MRDNDQIKRLQERFFETLTETTDAVVKHVEKLNAELKNRLDAQDAEIARLHSRIAEQEVEIKLLTNPDIVKFASRRGAA